MDFPARSSEKDSVSDASYSSYSSEYSRDDGKTYSYGEKNTNTNETNARSPHPNFVSFLEFAEMERQMKHYQADFHEAEETIDDLEQSLRAVLLAVSNATGTQVRTIDDALRLISNLQPSNGETDRVRALTIQLGAARREILELRQGDNNNEVEHLKNLLAESQQRCREAEQVAINTKKKLAKIIENTQQVKQQLKEKKAAEEKAKTTAQTKGKTRKAKITKKKCKGKAKTAAAKKAPVKTANSPKKGQEIVAMNNAQIAALETRIRELQFELETYKDSLRSPESSISSESSLPSILMGDNALKQFEMLVATQSEEIQQLYDQRDKLLELANAMEDNVEEAEDSLEEAERENIQLKEEVEEANNKIDMLKKSNNLEMQNLRNKIVDILPQSVVPKISLVQNLSPAKQIVEYFNFSNAELESALKKSYENISDAKMPQVLAQLENALKFMRTLSISTDNKTLLEDDDFKHDIFTQVKKIQTFINSLPKNTISEPSVFDARRSDEHVKAFLEIAEDEVNKSPVRELFSLFSGVVLVNKMLLQRVQTLEPLRQEADKSQNENEKLMNLLQEEANKQEKLAPQLCEICEEEEESPFYEMVENLLEKYNEMTLMRDSSIKDLNNIKADVAKIEKKTAEAVMERSTKYRNKIKALKLKNSSLEKQMATMKGENQKLLKRVVNSAEDSASLNEQVNTNKSQLEALQKQIEDLKPHKINEKLLLKKCKELEDEIAELNSKISKLTTENVLMENTVKNTKNNNKELIAAKEKLQNTNRELKDEIAAVKKVNEEIFNDIRNKNENLSDKIDGRLKMMEKSVEEANKKYDKAEEIRKEFLGKKKELKKQIAQLKASEVSHLVKIEELEKRLENTKKQMKADLDAQVLAAKMDNDKEQMSAKEFVVCCCKRLVQLIESSFLIQISGEIDLWDIVNILEEQLHDISADEMAKVLHDNSQARAILGISKQDTLWEGVQDLVNNMNDANDEIKTMQEDRKSLEKEISEVQDENRKFFESKSEAEEWKEWAKMLYQTVNDGAVSDNYRNALEEMILGGVGNKTIERKLSMLRSEKSLLQSHHDKLNEVNNKRVNSIRPHIISFMFIRRLQVCSGTLPTYVQFNVSKK